ncbi:FAD/NAD(P)-binding domain-containing protein [Zopfia rhizophila CBS 207.26]|uniref:FAD/NAD(P)-binding domain-containing protein n=1 Tax=Zopfia rhizophila CBS 207.26 TaxID=1314779 RepID=A0A6A6DNN6_9PEZI|nr:FAD/NAD(P)-binding domain-containing protein [Zopfia rhizophila CBS 207.26]
MANPADILIIGGGPAGLSAAASIVRQAHSIVIFDSGKYRNEASNYMHTLPTWDHRHPKEFRDAAKKDFERYGTVTLENAQVKSIKQTDEGLFEATVEDGRTWTGRKVILATGVEDVFPDIPGYADCWVSGIFHCLYCHGWEETGVATSGVLAIGDIGSVPHALHIARQALRISKEVTIYTNGNEQLAKDLRSALEKSPAPMKVDSRAIAKLVKALNRSEVTLHFEDGTEHTEGFLAHKPEAKLRGGLHEQLGLELTPQSTIKVNPPFSQTSVKGVFAAGDACTPMQTLTNALSTGTAAGAGAPLQLQAEIWNQNPLF